MNSHGVLMKDRSYLVSYPRSGANWLRYCIEVISGRITHGVVPDVPLTPLDRSVEEAARKILGKKLVPGIDIEAPPILQHSHRWSSSYDTTTIVLLVRDYKECILRDYRGTVGDDARVRQVISNNSLKVLCNVDGVKDYAELIQCYVDHLGPKHVVYYEDLKTNTVETLLSLGEFLNLNPAQIVKFLENIEEHNETSVRIYNNGVAKSYTEGTANIKLHSDEFLPPHEKRRWDNYIIKNHPDITPIIERYVDDA